MSGRVRSLIRVEGIVQGVGFRPFVHGLASRYGLAGLVGNDGGGVFIEAEGPPTAVAALVEAVRERAPALAVVERVSVTPVP
ncbi:acylphosphatase, partial [Nonomuraea sp. NPDC050405]